MPLINTTNLTQLIGKQNLIRLETLKSLEPVKYNLLLKKYNLHQELIAWSGNEQKVSSIKALIRELRNLY